MLKNYLKNNLNYLQNKNKEIKLNKNDNKFNISSDVIKNIINNNNKYLHDLEFVYNPITGKNDIRE